MTDGTTNTFTHQNAEEFTRPPHPPSSFREIMKDIGYLNLEQVISAVRVWHPEMSDKEIVSVMRNDIDRGYLKSIWLQGGGWDFIWRWRWGVLLWDWRETSTDTEVERGVCQLSCDNQVSKRINLVSRHHIIWRVSCHHSKNQERGGNKTVALFRTYDRRSCAINVKLIASFSKSSQNIPKCLGG